MLFEGGQTVHSIFKILLKVKETFLLLINKSSQNASVLHNEKHIMWQWTPTALYLALNAIG
jgi:hypothetical protein